LPIVPFASREAWEAFLEGQHATSEGLWLKLAKKGSGIESVTYDQAVEVALCYGWIDGQVRKLDEDYYLQRFTPRRPKSKWSKVNRKKATELIERVGALSYWGFNTGSATITKVVLAVGAPLVAAVVWGAFLSPRAPVELPWGLVLGLQTLVFASAAAGLVVTGHRSLALVFVVIVVSFGPGRRPRPFAKTRINSVSMIMGLRCWQ
jgi:hypothetical protein